MQICQKKNINYIYYKKKKPLTNLMLVKLFYHQKYNASLKNRLPQKNEVDIDSFY